MAGQPAWHRVIPAINPFSGETFVMEQLRQNLIALNQKVASLVERL